MEAALASCKSGFFIVVGVLFFFHPDPGLMPCNPIPFVLLV